VPLNKQTNNKNRDTVMAGELLDPPLANPPVSKHSQAQRQQNQIGRSTVNEERPSDNQGNPLAYETEGGAEQ